MVEVNLMLLAGAPQGCRVMMSRAGFGFDSSVPDNGKAWRM